jgi:hypothetical protein
LVANVFCEAEQGFLVLFLEKEESRLSEYYWKGFREENDFCEKKVDGGSDQIILIRLA